MKTSDLLAYCLICEKYLKGVYKNKLTVSWKKKFSSYLCSFSNHDAHVALNFKNDSKLENAIKQW